METNNASTITISVASVYHNAALYPYMPRAIFDALEAAFLAGGSSAEVPAALYDGFVKALPAGIRDKVLPNQ